MPLESMMGDYDTMVRKSPKRNKTRTLHCYICDKRFPEDNFYNDASRPLGKSSRCKKCSSIAALSYYYVYKDMARCRVKRRIVAKKWRAENLEKTKAYSAVSRALKTGVLVRPKSCENCDRNEKLNAHHKDYSKPLKVNWLCVLCHQEVHRAA